MQRFCHRAKVLATSGGHAPGNPERAPGHVRAGAEQPAGDGGRGDRPDRGRRVPAPGIMALDPYAVGQGALDLETGTNSIENGYPGGADFFPTASAVGTKTALGWPFMLSATSS